MKSYVLWFDQITKDMVPIVGGKGANLGEMFNIGLPVPPGYVVTTFAFKKFLDENNLTQKIIEILKNTDIEDYDSLKKASEMIQKMILTAKVPEDVKKEIVDAYKQLSLFDEHILPIKKDVLVAVRSSATAEDLGDASFAGQQVTFLNIKGEEELIKAVKACWASLYTTRAIYYREKKGFDHSKVLIAVVVQKMVNSDQSGIMFTANPINNNTDEIVIEGGFGLGEAFVSGEVNADVYIVDKKTLRIKEKHIGKQEFMIVRDENGGTKKVKVPEHLQEVQKIPDEKVIELAKYGLKIENHYKKPMDIEWAIENNNVYIVQARPITTIKTNKQSTQSQEEEKEKEKTREETTEEKVLLKGLPASPGIASGPVKVIFSADEIDKVQEGDVLVTTMTNPDMVPAMEKAVAIVTDEGGPLSHAAIVSRELGIPCVVGTEKATKVLKNGQIVTVDGTKGLVYEGKLVEDKKEEKQEKENIVIDEEIEAIIENLKEELEALDTTATEIKVIQDIPELAEKIAKLDVDGVGLVRLEFAVAEGGIHPAEYLREGKIKDYEDLVYKQIKKIAKAFYPRPVWVRTLDMRTDEYRNLKGGDKEPIEDNPMLGWHGIRRSLDQPELLEAELRAIKRLHDEGFTNVGVMFPFVISVKEVRKAKEIMKKVDLDPEEVEWGIMVETPAAVQIIEDLVKEGIKFISFGTNDLTQLTLGVDRNNERIQKLANELHPAVIKEIEKVIKVCSKHNVKTSICGQAGSKPEMAKKLVELGIDSISVNPDALLAVKKAVARAEKQLLLKATRELLRKE
ncbi:MAG: phosphoenolpyruvate synthase [Nanoarchaeota archaeon]